MLDRILALLVIHVNTIQKVVYLQNVNNFIFCSLRKLNYEYVGWETTHSYFAQRFFLYGHKQKRCKYSQEISESIPSESMTIQLIELLTIFNSVT